MKFADVVLDIANSSVDKTFEYIDELGVLPGMRVRVPFGEKLQQGFVVKVKDENSFDREKLKSIAAIIDDEPVLTEEQIRLAYYIEAQYHTTLTFALRFMIPSELRRGAVKAKSRKMVRLKALSNAERLLLRESCLSKDGKIKYKARAKTIEELEKADLPYGDVPKSVLDFLLKNDAAEVYEEELYRNPMKFPTAENKTNYTLTEDQEKAVAKINTSLEEGKKKTILLHGVTGSGKTEVYLRAAEKTLSLGKTVIMLVPEISLTPQLYAKFAERFGNKVAVIHSGLSAGERYDEWKKVKKGEAKIVLGARSAVFIPLENIGLIIIDEEHESSYKAENHPPYHAFEIANIRAHLNSSVLILGSATPQIETYLKAQIGMYELIELPSRIQGLPMPEIRIVDMRKEFQKGNPGAISGELYREMKRCLSAKKQVLLFINRRGYASSVQCRGCGAVVMCPHCDIPMKYHAKGHVLMCHYCGKTIPYSNICPSCGEPYLQNHGIGTQQVEEQVKKLFPGVKTLRMDFDSTRKKNAYEELYEAFRNHEADVLIGTQMIARGLDFDDVALAGIISADSMANYEDYRADERMFSMIEQVGGRAGRKEKGKVIIQTFDTENYIIECAKKHDYKAFYRAEIARRRDIGMPPYTKLFRMVFSHKDPEKAEKQLKEAEAEIRKGVEPFMEEVLLFTAKAAPVEKIQDKYRFHIILKVKNTKNTQQIKEMLFAIWDKARKGSVDVSIDTNPYETV